MEIQIPVHLLTEAHKAIADARVNRSDLARGGFAVASSNPMDAAGVATVLAFILFGPVRQVTIRSTRASSYGLKHAAESWGRRIAFSPYVSNGEFIVALIGDSHASALFPAVDAIARHRGWRLTPDRSLCGTHQVARKLVGCGAEEIRRGACATRRQAVSRCRNIPKPHSNRQ
mgnify:CR=1 FL=1